MDDARLHRRERVDEADYRPRGRSSSATKKAEAAFNISFARRNSVFSRLNRLISTAASVVTPGRSPASTCCVRIQVRIYALGWALANARPVVAAKSA